MENPILILRPTFDIIKFDNNVIIGFTLNESEVWSLQLINSTGVYSYYINHPWSHFSTIALSIIINLIKLNSYIQVSSHSFSITLPLLIVSLSSFNHISQHTTLAFLYVAPILPSTQLPYLIQKLYCAQQLVTFQYVHAIVLRVSRNSASLFQFVEFFLLEAIAEEIKNWLKSWREPLPKYRD